MNIRNLQRDMTIVATDLITISGQGSHGTLLANTPNGGAVQVVASAVGVRSQTTGGAGLHTFGVSMRSPQVDREPYRVKAGITWSAALSGQARIRGGLVVGYLPQAPTGTDDAVLNPVYIPFENGFVDDVILVDLYGEEETLRPLFVGIYIAEAAFTFDGYISVQRLSTAPMTYSSNVV